MSNRTGSMGEPAAFALFGEAVSDYGICMLDPEGRIATCNPATESVYGYDHDELNGKAFSNFFVEEDQAADKPEETLQIAARNGHYSDQGWRLRKNRSRFWALTSITALRDNSGKLLGYGHITRDLSEQKKAEERLRASEEQFRMLVSEVSEYAIFMLDPSGRVATWNSGAEKIKGYKASEIIGQNFSRFYRPEDIATGLPQRLLQLARENGQTRARGWRVRKDGSIFEADVLITALRSKAGEIRGYSKVTRDVTDQVRSREIELAKIAAEKASQAKDDFLAALSHELRTPLTPALAAAGYLAENAAEIAPEFTEQLAMIRRNIQLEARLIDDLLDLTRITRGMLQLKHEQVDAHALIQNALLIVKNTIEEKQLTLVTKLNAADHYLLGDPVRLEQVFWNLINNATKFTPPGGRITVETGNDGAGNLRFWISDTGIGIDAAHQPLLFQPFEQIDRRTNQRFGGLGLGLAISRNLVQLHNGSIGVESAGRDKGSTFVVTLPLAESQKSETASGGPRRSDRRGLRILLVEDHGDTRRTLCSLLRHFGHTISIADCVSAALDAMKAEQFDAVLSDIALPDGTGYEVIARAKRDQPVKGIALTGFGMEADVQRSREAGFDYHLTKPIDFAELRSVLAELAQEK